MTLTKEEDQILKTDVIGRVKTPPERRERLLDEFEKSGVSGMAFAKLVGVNYQTFAGWSLQRRRQRKPYPVLPKSPAKSVSQVRWLEAVMDQNKLPAGSAQSVLTVHLPGGARMEIADTTQAMLAAQVIRSLEDKPALSC